MELKIKVPDQLAKEALDKGVSVEVYVEAILSERARRDATTPSVAKTIDEILEMRRGKKLAGLKAKDLIREGRKY